LQIEAQSTLSLAIFAARVEAREEKLKDMMIDGEEEGAAKGDWAVLSTLHALGPYSV
jgi:hypothetical protein